MLVQLSEFRSVIQKVAGFKSQLSYELANAKQANVFQGAILNCGPAPHPAQL